MANDLSCKIERHGTRWVAHGIASYLQHENYHRDPWQTAPFPDRKSDAASLKDCNRWFAEVKKIQAAARPVDVKQLSKNPTTKEKRSDKQ